MPASRQTRVFRIALGVIAIAIADDAFLQPQPGTGAGDHLVSGLIPLGAAGAAWALYPRIHRGGARACLALVCGALAIGAGTAGAVRHLFLGAFALDDLLGLLGTLAGLVLVVLGGVLLWLDRRRSGSPTARLGRFALEAVLGGVAIVLGLIPVEMALVATHAARAPVPPAQLGAPYRAVRFMTSDGLRLSGWYVAPRNGAAVIVAPGRSPAVQAHARLLIRHGYGVLVFDRRGEGRSEGDRNLYGWSGEKDMIAAADFLRRQPGVKHGMIGGLGLSVGGEMLLQAAAQSPALKAVVSEGAGRRSLLEHVHIPELGTVQKWVTPWVVQTGALAVLSNASPPPYLGDVVARIAPRPILLIRALHGLPDESLNRVLYAAARAPKTLWEVNQGGHTGALEAVPAQYEVRVVGFFDRALPARLNQG